MWFDRKPDFEKCALGRLRHGDAQALCKICCPLLNPLERMLGQAKPSIEKAMVAESAEDALLDYLSRPERFDPSRGVPLLRWLFIQARGHLSNKLRQKRSRQQHERPVGVRGEQFEKFVSEMSHEMTTYQGKEKEALAEERLVLDNLVMRLSFDDREEVALLRRGASFKEWVQLLGIDNYPAEVQHKKINAEKDRLKKKLKRWAQKMPRGVKIF